MPKSNKLHKRHLLIRYEITYLERGAADRVAGPDELMNMELDIPRRWANKDIFEFAKRQIGRKGKTDKGKGFKVHAIHSISVFFPEDDNRELKLLGHAED